MERKIPLLSSLPKLLIVAFLIFTILIPIIQCKVRPSSQTYNHQSSIKFYYKQQAPFQQYYWVIVQAQYQSDNFTVALNQLLWDIKAIKALIRNDESIKQKNVTFHSQKSIQLITGSPLDDNSDIMKQLINPASNFQTKLTDMQVSFEGQSYTVSQLLYIRIDNNRKILAQFVDRLQQQLSQNDKNSMKIVGVMKDSIKDFYQREGISKGEQTQESLKNEEEKQQIQREIFEQAEGYCKGLNMKLQQVLSFKEMTSIQQIQKSQKMMQNPVQNEEAEIEQLESFEELTYYDAYEEKLENESIEPNQGLFLVKAKCTGHRPFSSKFTKISQESEKHQQSDKLTTGQNIQAQIQILKNRKTTSK